MDKEKVLKINISSLKAISKIWKILAIKTQKRISHGCLKWLESLLEATFFTVDLCNVKMAQSNSLGISDHGECFRCIWEFEKRIDSFSLWLLFCSIKTIFSFKVDDRCKMRECIFDYNDFLWRTLNALDIYFLLMSTQ